MLFGVREEWRPWIFLGAVIVTIAVVMGWDVLTPDQIGGSPYLALAVLTGIVALVAFSAFAPQLGIDLTLLIRGLAGARMFWGGLIGCCSGVVLLFAAASADGDVKTTLARVGAASFVIGLIGLIVNVAAAWHLNTRNDDRVL